MALLPPTFIPASERFTIGKPNQTGYYWVALHSAPDDEFIVRVGHLPLGDDVGDLHVWEFGEDIGNLLADCCAYVWLDRVKPR